MSKAAVSDSLLPPRWVIAILGVSAFAWLLIALKEIVAMLVLGYSLAYLIDPLLGLLERRKISRTSGFFLIAGAFVLTLVLLVFTALPTLLREYEKLADNFPSYVQTAAERGGPLLEKFKSYLPKRISTEAVPNPASWLPELNAETIRKVVATIGSTLLQGYSITLTILNFFLLPFIVFYLAIDLPTFHSWLISIFPSQHRKRAIKIAGEIDAHTSAFIRGQLTVGCILFLLYCLGLGFVGVELWFLLAIISGFGSIIPYMGFLIGIVLSSIMALVTFGDWSHLLQVIAVFLVVQFLEGTFITPRVVGNKVGLSPLVVILAIVAGGQLFGLLGVFLAVPGAAAVRVLLKHLHASLVS